MQSEDLIKIAKVLNENGLKGKERDSFLRDKYNMSSRTWQKKIKGTPIKYNNSTKKYDILDSFDLENTNESNINKEKALDNNKKLQKKLSSNSKETQKEPKRNTKVTTKEYQSNLKETIDEKEENPKVISYDSKDNLQNNYDEAIEVKDIKEVLPEVTKVTTPLKIQEFKNMKSDIEVLKEQMNFILDRFKEEEFKKENIIEIPKIDLENYDLKGDIGSRSFKTYKYVLDDFKKFCKKRNESQKDLIAIALLEFMKKYNR